jgi:hypothetical protein
VVPAQPRWRWGRGFEKAKVFRLKFQRDASFLSSGHEETQLEEQAVVGEEEEIVFPSKKSYLQNGREEN